MHDQDDRPEARTTGSAAGRPRASGRGSSTAPTAQDHEPDDDRDGARPRSRADRGAGTRPARASRCRRRRRIGAARRRRLGRAPGAPGGGRGRRAGGGRSPRRRRARGRRVGSAVGMRLGVVGRVGHPGRARLALGRSIARTVRRATMPPSDGPDRPARPRPASAPCGSRRAPSTRRGGRRGGGGYGGDRRLRRLGLLLAARRRPRDQGRHAVRAAVGLVLPRRRSAAGRSRSCRATAAATRSRRTGSTTGRTSGRCARSGSRP